MDTTERFWSKVQKSDDCWLWNGHCRQSKGGVRYGCFSVGYRDMPAHRWAYAHAHGPIPDGMQIDHLCRNTLCVNPNHLEAVTRRENILRSTSFAAENARKSHCPQGHAYTPENTIVSRTRYRRRCRQCVAQRHARYNERMKVMRAMERAS